MVAGDTLEVIVNGNTTVVALSNMLFLGNPTPTNLFNTGLMSGTTQTFPNPEVYTFVDIKTGLPTDG
jgi:hypothetical protein